MTLRAVLLPDQGAAAAGPGFFNDPDFYAAEGLTHSLVLKSGTESVGAVAVRVRDIPGSAMRDAVSAYGYPGLSELEPISLDRIDWQGTELVSLFVRGAVGRCGPGYRPRGVLQIVDPRLPLRIRRAHRYDISRNTRLGLLVHETEGPHCPGHLIRDVHAVYTATMQRDGAQPRYFFPLAYFERLLRCRTSKLVSTVDSDGRLCAAAVAVESGGYMHYYLAATADHATRWSPSKNCISRLVDIACSMRVPLNLGGGLSPGDGLEHFKAGFANATVPFCTLEQICHPVEYARLAANVASDGDFFPAYRAGSVLVHEANLPIST
jgi:hypothetical protein